MTEHSSGVSRSGEVDPGLAADTLIVVEGRLAAHFSQPRKANPYRDVENPWCHWLWDFGWREYLDEFIHAEMRT